MLPNDDQIRLQHMLDAARKAVHLVAGRGREALDAEDDPLPYALVHLIAVIGEAASRVNVDTRSKFGDTPGLTSSACATG